MVSFSPDITAFRHAEAPEVDFNDSGAGGTDPNSHRVIVVDDEEGIRELLCSIVRLADCSPIPVDTIEKLDGYLSDSRPSDLIILDLNLGNTDGVSVLGKLRDGACKSSIIVLSGCEDRVRRSVVDFGKQFGLNMLPPIAKPFDPSSMVDVIRRYSNDHRPLSDADVQHAIDECEFIVHTQPFIDLNTRQVVGAEALVRWVHPRRGLVYPDAFIPLIEQRPIVLPLTMEVARLAFEAISRVPMPLRIAINIPTLCLADLQFPDQLMELSRRHGIEPERIALEITETAAMTDPAFTAAQVTRLRIKGFSIALDDFGTGYGSLVDLHRMPVSDIKIDKSFVMQLRSDEEARAIVRSIISLGHNLGLKTIAEGIEDKDTMSILRGWDCDMGQGYHIARPMPASALIDWMISWEEKRLVH